MKVTEFLIGAIVELFLLAVALGVIYRLWGSLVGCDYPPASSTTGHRDMQFPSLGSGCFRMGTPCLI